MKKIRHFLVAAVLLLACLPAGAQWNNIEYSSGIRQYIKHAFEVYGHVFGTDDYEPDPFPLQSANVKVTCLGDTTLFSGASVAEDGSFSVWLSSRKRLKDTRIHVSISYLGMDGYECDFDPEKSDEYGYDNYTVKLDTIVLKSHPATTEEVEIVEELVRMYQRGDTVIFNADAYEMPSGSVLLDLVRRLPGLSYKNGKLMYMDRDIQEIKLNGNSFFQRDMTIALNNMPHEKLKSLKVYEELDDTLDVMSDEHLVMDMVTKEPMSHALLGSLGLGTTEKFDRYQLTASANNWKEKGGEFYSNFSWSDIPDSYNVCDESKDISGNLSYYYNNGENLYAGGGADYYGNSGKNRSGSLSRSFMPDYTQTSVSENSNYNSSRSLGSHFNINSNSRDKGSWSTSLSFNLNGNESSSQSRDSISNDNTGLVSTTQQENSSTSSGRNFNWSGSYSTSFGKDDRFSLFIDSDIAFDKSESTTFNSSYSRFVQLGDSVRDIRHRITAPSKGKDMGAGARVYMNIEKMYAQLGMNVSYNDNSSVQNYEDEVQGGYRNVDSLHYDRFNSNLGYSLNGSFMYEDSIISANVSGSMKPVIRNIDNNQYGDREQIRNTGITWNANASIRFIVGKKSQFDLSYYGNSSLPGVSQLSKVTDYSDPMNIREGNPNLKDSQSHNGNMSFQFRTWARITAGIGTTLNELTTLSIVDSRTGARRTSPANINGSWNTNGRLFLTKDFSDLTLSSTTAYSFRHNVSYVQESTGTSSGAVMKSGTDWHNLNTSLNASWSNGYWMTSAILGYSLDNSSSDYMSKPTKGQHLSASGSIEWTSDFGLQVGTNINYDKPFGYEMASANRQQCLWNVNAGYRFLKNKQANIWIEWRDILDSYTGFNASMSSTTWNESRSYGESNMFVITFNYRLNDF